MSTIRFIRFVAGLAAVMFSATLAQAETIVVGGKNFTEQLIMADITSKLLAANGFDVDTRTGMGSATVRQAMENGQISLYWEYTGTSLITYNKIDEKLDAQATYDRVKQLDAKKGLVWLNPSSANNTYALAMRREESDKLGIKTISDLAKHENEMQDLTFASSAEFYARSDGLKPMETAYGFEFGRADVKRMDSGLIYQALKDGSVNVGLVFATDGRIPAFNFTVLADDKGYFPSYAMTPVIRSETLEKNPKLGDLLNQLSAKLDNATVARLNAEVDVGKKSIGDVASDFLKSAGLQK